MSLLAVLDETLDDVVSPDTQQRRHTSFGTIRQVDPNNHYEIVCYRSVCVDVCQAIEQAQVSYSAAASEEKAIIHVLNGQRYTVRTTRPRVYGLFPTNES